MTRWQGLGPRRRAIALAPPVNIVLPVITGTTTQGETLSVSTGTWLNAPLSYQYQWKRGGVSIVGATGPTYDQVLADVGANISVTVTAINDDGNATATALSVGPVIAAVGIGGFMDFSDSDNSALLVLLEDV